MASNRSGAALRSIRALFTAGTVGGLTDRQLLERFSDRDGDGDGDGAELAFASLVERHGPMVLRLCRAVLRDDHEAEDAFQATFLILALKAGSIRGGDSLTSWLYRVAYNVAATARSSAARRRAHELKAGQARSLAFTEDARDDLGPVIHEELGRMPERYRAVLVLYYVEGLTQHQAAQRLGWPLGTVQSRLARGRERLRARLVRRGLAPAAAVLAWPVASEAAHAVIPPALANATVRLALTIGAARALVVGAIPSAVMNLAKGAMRKMLVHNVSATSMAALLAAGTIAMGAGVYAYQAARPDPAPAPGPEVVKREQPATPDFDDGLLTIRGVVRLRDGSAVAGATGRSFTGSDEPSTVARTDDLGQFQIRAVFGNGCCLHVSSADGLYQTVLKVRSGATRALLTTPVELTLLPSLHHDVTVLSDGHPVAGAHIVASGIEFQVQGVTGADGKVRLRLPAKEQLSNLVAWHPTLGGAGTEDLEGRPREGSTELSLLPPGRLTIRVVDVHGKPVGGLELGVSANTEDSRWILAKDIAAAHVRTGADGTAIVSWVPRDHLRYVEVDLLGSDWKLDETDLTTIRTGMVTVHARRERAVQGRLIMPAGADAQGILVMGRGSGPTHNGDIPHARARHDGTFTLRVPSDHGYVLGIVDPEWATDPWSGMILVNDSAEPAAITMNVYPATPLTVRVTRGPERGPVSGAWLSLTSKGRINWNDRKTGVKLSGSMGGTHTWLTTNADGAARSGIGKGEHVLRLTSGDWSDQRTLNVTSDKPLDVEFHREWNGKQQVAGRLVVEGVPHSPSPTLAAHAWCAPKAPFGPPLSVEPVVHPDGSFDVAFDAESVSLLFIDQDQQQSGFANRLLGDAHVDVNMEPTATCAGALVDDKARPVAGIMLEMCVKTSELFSTPIATQRTDQQGRFRFTGVPSNVSLRFKVRRQLDEPECYIANDDPTFKPGEIREHEQLKLREYESPSGKSRTATPLSTTITNLCRNARATRMRMLVAILGDDSGDTARTIDQLLDYEVDRMRAALSYVTLRVEAKELKSAAGVLTARGWPVPSQRELVLVALDGDQKTIAAQRIATSNVATAVDIGVAFLNQNRPPVRNAISVLAAARSEAKRSGRRVWVILGGPLCAPCFRLARWIENQHTTLEQDYVVVELMEGVDDHVIEAIAGLPTNDRDGIPWFAITEPDGTVLAISRGPSGNIGFPNSVEGIRHFRQMLDRTVQRITIDEVDRLIKSLSSVR